ncbi:MAG: hypothetical protein ABIK19_06130, partial [candidate division WOR-3 bacterium]
EAKALCHPEFVPDFLSGEYPDTHSLSLTLNDLSSHADLNSFLDSANYSVPKSYSLSAFGVCLGLAFFVYCKGKFYFNDI